MDHIRQMVSKARRLLLRRGASIDDADDIVQEAFARLEAYTRSHEVRSQEAFVMNAALNINRDQARRRRNAPFVVGEIDPDLIADRQPAADEVLRAHERLRRADAGLAQLDPVTRRCLIAKRVDGLTYPQIANVEGLAVATIEKRVARALVFLTKWMDGW
jgi:RNA polymerase sigma-70 factor (ECF subfamily)